MIQGTTELTEAGYRAIKRDSYSSIKDFSMDRKKYFRKYITNEIIPEEEEEKDTKASVIGRLVETLLMESNRFDELFYMSACMSTPTGLMLAFVEALYVVTRNATNDDGVVTRDFEELSKEAYTQSGYKILYPAVIGKFTGSDAEVYYNEIRLVRAKNLTVVTMQDVSNAEKIVEELKTNPITATIVNLTNSARYTVENQMKIEEYVVDGHIFKSMLDKVIIDHVQKSIQIYDLKCVWTVEGFYKEYYTYRRAYIQAFLYCRAMLAITLDVNNPLYGYNVYPPSFIVCDSTNYFSPLIYTLSMEDLQEAYNGFEYMGKQYPGVKEIIKNLQWALDMNIWNISRENYLKKGVTNIKE